MLKKWNVYVNREGRSLYLGKVSERSEALARCAALSRFGVSQDDIDAGEAPSRGAAIYPDDDFEVQPTA